VRFLGEQHGVGRTGEMEAIAENRELTQAELEHETCERRRGRNIVVAIDHGPDSRAAFEWTLTHFVRMADTLYLVHVIPSCMLSSSSSSSSSSSCSTPIYLFLFVAN
jgi:hypothetical protein